MSNSAIKQKEEQVKYSRLLSSLFCLVAIVSLSMLCLLNHFTIDFYTTIVLIKVVTPAAFCFWAIGNAIGKILDGLHKEIVQKKIVEEKQAYEIPSMFASNVEYDENDDEDTGVLWKNFNLNTLKHLN